MKTLLRKTLFNAFALFLLSQIIAGFDVLGGAQTFILAGLALAAISYIVRPILRILTLPLNLVTFGTFSFFTNAILLYILTVLVPQITVSAFVFPGITLAGFIIPKIACNVFFAYVVCAFILSTIDSFLSWLAD